MDVTGDDADVRLLSFASKTGSLTVVQGGGDRKTQPSQERTEQVA